jgi:hypothetical protein
VRFWPFRVDDRADKDAVPAAQKKGDFTIPHFDGYPAMLNELKTVTSPARREALIDGWLPWVPNDLVGDFIARARGRRRRHPATLATKRR